MPFPVKATVQVEGGPALGAAFAQLTLEQHAFTHHTFTLDLSCEALGRALGLDPALVPTQAHQQLVGKGLALSWQSRLPKADGRSFAFKGLITEVSLRTDADLVNYYQLSGYSPTILLEDGSQRRTFVKQAAGVIFQQVLAPYPGNAFARQLSPQHADTLPYVVQYQETNFQFLSRLAASQGEWFYYDGQTLHLGRQAGKTIAFRSDNAQQFALSLRLQPTITRSAAYNYRTHQALAVQAAAPGQGHAFSTFASQQSAALFTQPQRLAAGPLARDQGQLQRALDQLAARQASSQVSLRGSGEAFDAAPGAVLDVQDAAGTSYGQFWVLSVRHELDGAGNYQNQFEALPAAAQVPPPNPYVAQPAAQPELAQVIDLADPKRLGRVRVRYPWDVAQPAQAESGWLRVSTPYSGDGKGQLFTPEVGSQVLVGYEQGSPDYPVVLGNLFHAQNPQQAKYTNPDNNLKGLQTAGGNKFVLHDTPGQQKILLSNSNNKGTAVTVGFDGDGNVSITTNGPISLTAGGDISLTAKQNITLTATEDIKLAAKNVLVEAKENIDKKAKKIAATGSDNLDLKGKATTLKADDTMQIAASSSLDVNGGSKASISSGQTRIH